MLFSGIALALSILLSVFIGRTGGHWSPFIGWSYSSMFIPALSLFLVIVFFLSPRTGVKMGRVAGKMAACCFVPAAGGPACRSASPLCAFQ